MHDGAKIICAEILAISDMLMKLCIIAGSIWLPRWWTKIILSLSALFVPEADGVPDLVNAIAAVQPDQG